MSEEVESAKHRFEYKKESTEKVFYLRIIEPPVRWKSRWYPLHSQICIKWLYAYAPVLVRSLLGWHCHVFNKRDIEEYMGSAVDVLSNDLLYIFLATYKG